jgi:hypothetical protein
VKTKLEVGLRWGRLEATSFGVEDRDIEIRPGWVETYKDAVYYVLKCDCGNEVRIWERDWKGKRVLRDCGCGMSVLDGMNTTICVSMPARTYQEIKTYARKNSLTVSKAIVDCVLNVLNQKIGRAK